MTSRRFPPPWTVEDNGVGAPAASRRPGTVPAPFHVICPPLSLRVFHFEQT